jgi:TolA-binding protein
MSRHEQAEKLFEKILAGKTGKVEADRFKVQKAYAEFGYAASQQGQGQHRWKDAKANYVNSIKTYKEGSWHDETLFNLVTLTLRQAETKYNQESRARKDAEPSKKPNKTKRQTEADRKQAEADKKKHLATLQQSRLEAMPYLQELLTRYPKSPRLPEALYQLGLLQVEQAESAAGDDKTKPAKVGLIEKLFKDAAATLTKFTTDYPDSPHAGDAHVKLIDIQLERLFDLPAAQTSANKAVAWAKQHEPKNKKPAKADSNPNELDLPLWAIELLQVSTSNHHIVLYDVYLRRAFVAYLEDEMKEAASWFKKADAIGAPRPYQVVHGSVPSGPERLMQYVRRGKQLTPPEVRNGSKKNALLLALGDLYFHAENWLKARELYQIVRERKSDKSVTNSQKAWAAFMIARTHFWSFEFTEANKYYSQVFEKYPKSPWADRALLYNATMAYSNLRNKSEAKKCLSKLIKEYPGGEMAERATYLIGQIYQWDKEWEIAKLQYAAYLKKYPKGMYVQGIKKLLLPEIEKELSKQPQPKQKQIK